MSIEVFTLEKAKRLMQAGERCHPDYFGKGWSIIYDKGTEHFYAVNPVTGSTMQHTFAQRDRAANWRKGVALRGSARMTRQSAKGGNSSTSYSTTVELAGIDRLTGYIPCPEPTRTGLRNLRLYHWRKALWCRGVAQRATTKRERGNFNRQADKHIGHVQTLNDFFPIGDTAEGDNVRPERQADGDDASGVRRTDELVEQNRRLHLTAVVDDDYPEVRHQFESALANFIRKMKENGRFEKGNRYGLGDVIAISGERSHWRFL